MQLLQYLSDDTGKHTAVVILISEWENIIRKYPDLRLLEQSSSTQQTSTGKYTMGDFVGTLASDSADPLLKYVGQSRDEWDKDRKEQPKKL